jgi:hypothetical protein
MQYLNVCVSFDETLISILAGLEMFVNAGRRYQLRSRAYPLELCLLLYKVRINVRNSVNEPEF